MLTYTFSTREKVLLAALAFVAILVGWYQLVFLNIQNQMSAIDSEIASVQNDLVVYQSQAAAMQKMESVVREYEEQGIKPVEVPQFDNTRNLMAYLNGVLAQAPDYTVTFDDPVYVAEEGSVHRAGTIAFSSASYEDARAIVANIAKGPYPCQIDALGISDDSANATSSDALPVKATVQLTFFELPNDTMRASSSDDLDIPEGNDWSQYMDK